MKILHGMSDIAGQATYSVDGLKKIGENADLAVWRRNPVGYPDLGKDIHIGTRKILYPFYILKILFFFVSAFFKYDVFHFHFGHSLIPGAFDLFWLKISHKKTFMEFHGSEVRFSYDTTRPKFFYADKVEGPGKSRVKKNDRIFKYIGACITHDEELRKHIPVKRLFITPLRIDISRFEPVYPKAIKNKPIIVHAPSNYMKKGTKYVIESMERLKIKYDFEFILVMNKTQKEALEIYKNADIIIDQMFGQSYGVFAVESMALGKPVITYITDEVKRAFPPELPIFSASIETLDEVVEKLILNGKLREQAGRAGRKYVEDYHDNRKIAKVQADIYKGVIEPMTTLDSFLYVKEKQI